MITPNIGNGKQQGGDGASEWVGRTIHYTVSAPAGAGKVWQLARGEWSQVPDPVGAGDLDEALSAAGFTESAAWGDPSRDQVSVRLYSGRDSFLLVLLLGEDAHMMLAGDLPSLLALLPPLLDLVAADQALARRG
jgi:hypothetical protein